MFYINLGVALVAFTVVGLVFRHFIKVSRERTDEESGITPIFEETGGCRIDAINYTWPFARHSIYEDFIVIKCIGGSCIIPRKELSVNATNGIFSSGISYTTPKRPGREFIVWSKNKDKVLAILEDDA